MKTIEQIGKPGVALLNPFRGAFHGGAKDFLSETETRKNHGIRRQRTTEKGHPGTRWRHRKRCVWRHVRTFEPRKKAGERNKFSTLSDSQPPGGLLDNSNTLEPPCKKFNFRQRKNIEKGHRKSVASRPPATPYTRNVSGNLRTVCIEGCKVTAQRKNQQKPLPKAYRNTSPLSNTVPPTSITVNASVP